MLYSYSSFIFKLLNISTFVENNINTMKKLDWFILVILLISPILINYIVLGVSVGATINGSIDGWLGYYGTLIGSIITMFVLYRTRAWNKDDNEDTRKTQNNILKYQVKQVWLEGLRKQLDANYRVLNFQETMIAANNIANGDCLKAMGYLMNLNKDIEMQGYSFDLYLSGDNLNENEIEYISCYQHVLKQYGEYVNDLILIPKHFFVPDIIEKRKPLAQTARRAGWVGCNIVIDKIPEQGRISIISSGNITNINSILNKVNQSNKLETKNMNSRGWIMDVLNCVNKISTQLFTLEDMYVFECELQSKHPENYNVKPKIRQQLQLLRDKGFIEFLGNGKYRKLT
mgnify:CR=1 FL=1